MVQIHCKLIYRILKPTQRYRRSLYFKCFSGVPGVQNMCRASVGPLFFDTFQSCFEHFPYFWKLANAKRRTLTERFSWFQAALMDTSQCHSVNIKSHITNLHILHNVASPWCLFFCLCTWLLIIFRTCTLCCKCFTGVPVCIGAHVGSFSLLQSLRLLQRLPKFHGTWASLCFGSAWPLPMLGIVVRLGQRVLVPW